MFLIPRIFLSKFTLSPRLFILKTTKENYILTPKFLFSSWYTYILCNFPGPLDSAGSRIILLTDLPSYGGPGRCYNARIDLFVKTGIKCIHPCFKGLKLNMYNISISKVTVKIKKVDFTF